MLAQGEPDAVVQAMDDKLVTALDSDPTAEVWNERMNKRINKGAAYGFFVLAASQPCLAVAHDDAQ